MSAAEKSDKNKVIQLIREAGVSIHVTTTFTPTGIRIILDNSEVEGGCCDLMIAFCVNFNESNQRALFFFKKRKTPIEPS